MATTFKAVVYAHQKRRDGTYNVKIRVTHNRASRNLPTNVTVTPEQLTRGLKIKDHKVADALGVIIKKLRDAASEIGYAAADMDVDQVVAKIRHRLKEKEAFSLDFYQYGMDYARPLKSGTRITYNSAFAAVLAYTRDRRPDINDVTSAWVRGYIEFLQERNLSGDTVRLYVSKLSKVHARARLEFNDEDAGLIRIPLSPFSNVKAPVAPRVGGHRNVSRETVQRIIDLPAEPRIRSRRNLARDVFLLSISMQGINLADLWDAVEGPAGFVTYVRKKTADRHPVKMVLRIEEEARALLSEYSDGPRLLGRLVNHYQSYEGLRWAVIEGMEAISEAVGEKVTYYSARHTWATLARNDCNIDKYTVHEALTHSDAATKIDDVYIATDYSKFWDANRAVLDLFDWSRR